MTVRKIKIQIYEEKKLTLNFTQSSRSILIKIQKIQKNHFSVKRKSSNVNLTFSHKVYIFGYAVKTIFFKLEKVNKAKVISAKFLDLNLKVVESSYIHV